MKRLPGHRNSRQAAAEIVAQWLATGDFPDRLVARVDEDRAFVMEMVFGIARQRRLLEWVVDRYVRRLPPEPVVACLLVGLYQLLMLDTVADFAAVHETVEAAKTVGGGRWSDLVNGVLRAVQREKAELKAEIPKLPVGVRLSHPDVLISRWERCFGESRTAALCVWNNTRPQVTLCVNPLRTSVAELLERLRAGGIEAAPHPFAPERFVSLPHGAGIAALPGYDEGLFSVQDPSTAASVELLDPRPGERILDACAAPGGKTALIAQRMQGRGELVAADEAEERLTRLRENLRRLRLDRVRVVRGDAAAPCFRELCGPASFDRILLDVPCSNTGVLRRRPDARWRFSLLRVANLTQIQRALLDNAAALLKPGGRLVYSTCSLEPQEGPLLLESWREHHPEFARLRDVALFPPETQTDGIFAAAVACRT